MRKNYLIHDLNSQFELKVPLAFMEDALPSDYMEYLLHFEKFLIENKIYLYFTPIVVGYDELPDLICSNPTYIDELLNLGFSLDQIVPKNFSDYSGFMAMLDEPDCLKTIQFLENRGYNLKKDFDDEQISLSACIKRLAASNLNTNALEVLRFLVKMYPEGLETSFLEIDFDSCLYDDKVESILFGTAHPKYYDHIDRVYFIVKELMLKGVPLKKIVNKGFYWDTTPCRDFAKFVLVAIIKNDEDLLNDLLHLESMFTNGLSYNFELKNGEKVSLNDLVHNKKIQQRFPLADSVPKTL